MRCKGTWAHTLYKCVPVCPTSVPIIGAVMKPQFKQLADMVREKRRQATGGRVMQDYRLEEHGEDFTIIGVGMTAEAAEEIKLRLPEDTRSRVIGWRRLGQ